MVWDSNVTWTADAESDVCKAPCIDTFQTQPTTRKLLPNCELAYELHQQFPVSEPNSKTLKLHSLHIRENTIQSHPNLQSARMCGTVAHTRQSTFR